MKRIKVKLESKFHNNETYVLAERVNEYTLQISNRQYKDALRRICVKGCCCPVTSPKGMLSQTLNNRGEVTNWTIEEID